MATPPNRIPLPEGSLVLLVGPSGSGKSTFARRHFRASEILSSDALRLIVSDDENDQRATPDAFRALHLLADARLRRRRTTIVDATNLRRSARRPLLDLAAVRRAAVVAIVFDLPSSVIATRNRERLDRHLPDDALARQQRLLTATRRDLPEEGLSSIVVLGSVEAVDSASVVRTGGRETSRRRDPGSHHDPAETHGVDGGDDHGPFDIGGVDQ